jgi:hypothetical protein
MMRGRLSLNRWSDAAHRHGDEAGAMAQEDRVHRAMVPHARLHQREDRRIDQ